MTHWLIILSKQPNIWLFSPYSTQSLFFSAAVEVETVLSLIKRKMGSFFYFSLGWMSSVLLVGIVSWPSVFYRVCHSEINLMYDKFSFAGSGKVCWLLLILGFVRWSIISYRIKEKDFFFMVEEFLIGLKKKNFFFNGGKISLLHILSLIRLCILMARNVSLRHDLSLFYRFKTPDRTLLMYPSNFESSLHHDDPEWPFR